jgi:phosphate transport system protein
VRETFHGGLRQLGIDLTSMCHHAAGAIRAATEALLTADLAAAEQVLAEDAGLDALRDRCEEQAHVLLALQAPVARDLRTVLAAVYCADKIERMGDLAAHIADTARFAYPGHVVPESLTSVIADLGSVTSAMADRLGELVSDHGPAGHAELDHTDETVDELHAQILTAVTRASWEHGAAVAARLALVSRFYERFGDQAVSVAKRLDFIVTGEVQSPSQA